MYMSGVTHTFCSCTLYMYMYNLSKVTFLGSEAFQYISHEGAGCEVIESSWAAGNNHRYKLSAYIQETNIILCVSYKL